MRVTTESIHDTTELVTIEGISFYAAAIIRMHLGGTIYLRGDTADNGGTLGSHCDLTLVASRFSEAIGTMQLDDNEYVREVGNQLVAANLGRALDTAEHPADTWRYEHRVHFVRPVPQQDWPTLSDAVWPGLKAPVDQHPLHDKVETDVRCGVTTNPAAAGSRYNEMLKTRPDGARMPPYVDRFGMIIYECPVSFDDWLEVQSWALTQPPACSIVLPVPTHSIIETPPIPLHDGMDLSVPVPMTLGLPLPAAIEFVDAINPDDSPELGLRARDMATFIRYYFGSRVAFHGPAASLPAPTQ